MKHMVAGRRHHLLLWLEIFKANGASLAFFITITVVPLIVISSVILSVIEAYSPTCVTWRIIYFFLELI